MPSFSGSAGVQADLVEIYRKSVPQDIASDNRDLDEAYAFGAIFGAAESVVADWTRQIRLGTATGAGLNQQTKDRGLRRQAGESDDTLRQRDILPPEAGTAPAILRALQAIVDVNGGGTVFLKQLPRDGAYCSRSFCLDRGERISGGVVRMVIALIPASANCLSACTDALRAKVSAAKAYLVQEYVSG